MSVSQVRQNYHEDCEAGMNRHINLELFASYVYHSMAFHFDRDDVALAGFHKFFKHQSEDERSHAQLLMEYQQKRGGRVVLQDIKKPEKNAWGNGLEAMKTALQLERNVNESLLALEGLAASRGDMQTSHFIKNRFLNEQVNSIKEIGDFVTELSRVGPGMGEYLFDQETLQEKDYA